jgi:hypothetical protein
MHDTLLYCVDHVVSDQDPYRDLILWFLGTDPDPCPDPAQTLSKLIIVHVHCTYIRLKSVVFSHKLNFWISFTKRQLKIVKTVP